MPWLGLEPIALSPLALSPLSYQTAKALTDFNFLIAIPGIVCRAGGPDASDRPAGGVDYSRSLEVPGGSAANGDGGGLNGNL
jgi:hypothetical protein